MTKLIVLGAPLTGKTTLAKELRKHTDIPILDFDDELLKLNNGKYPANYPALNEKLKTQVIQDIISRDSVVFFAFEIDIETLKEMRNRGFTIVQLSADIETLRERNIDRLKEQPDNDAFQYVEKNLEYQNKIKELGLVDEIIDATRPLVDVVKQFSQMLRS